MAEGSVYGVKVQVINKKWYYNFVTCPAANRFLPLYPVAFRIPGL